jgi:hypothetical protein
VTRASLDRFRIGPKRGFSAFRIAMSPRDKLANEVDEVPEDPTSQAHQQNRWSRLWCRFGADPMTAAVDPLHE